MLEEAVERIAPLVGRDSVYIATSNALESAVRRFDILPEARVLAEPTRRNTLGALCWIAASLQAEGRGGATVAILTSDHMIGEQEYFRATVAAALETAEAKGALVTIGVPPTRPETGYGYIELDLDDKSTLESGRIAYRSLSFREKPSAETAEEFVKAQRFYWNSGMFFFTIPSFLEELKVAQPEAHAAVEQIVAALRAGDRRAAQNAFESLPNISVDYAVMEKAKKVFVIPADFPWDDVGAWDALGRALPLDAQRNVSQGTTVILDSDDCVVINDDDEAVVGVIGLEGIVVVNTRDAILVCPKSRAQEVRKISVALAQRREV